MKRRLKNALEKLGALDSINWARALSSTLRWIGSGCSGPAPHPVKMRIVRAYLHRFRLRNFVETGTYEGETLRFIARSGVYCTSIELSEEMYNAARSKFRDYTNVRLIHGDSGVAIPQLLAKINAPTLFWLDGHYSAGNTATGESHTPINEELSSILAHPITNHVILIDDAHCFRGMDGYPHLDELLQQVRAGGNYLAEVSADIIRLVAKAST